MASYYYLVASLPTLSFDQSPPLSIKQFMEKCQAELSKKDYKVLENLFNEQESPLHPFIEKYRAFSFSLNEVLNYFRGQKLQRIDESQTRKFSESNLVEIVKLALSAENPLRGELALLKYRWDYISSLASFKYFELEVVLAYAVHLKLAQRKALFDDEKGKVEFESILISYKRVLRAYKRSVLLWQKVAEKLPV